MRRFSMPALVVVGLWLMLGLATEAGAQQVTLLHLSDTHSHLAAGGPKDANLDGTLGGLSRAASIVVAAKAEDPQALFVHAGDFMQGDLFFNEWRGVPELQLLQSIGLDALVLGNRDFQLGSSFLTGVLAEAWTAGGSVPILATNINPAGHALGGWITPTLIKDINGVKVGLLGLSPPNGALARPEPVVIGPDLTGIAAAAVQTLRDAGAQVVIAVTHLGMDLSRQLAGSVSGLDVIVNAHDNAVLLQPEVVARPGGASTLIVAAGSYYRWVGRLRLSVSGSQVTLVDYALIPADAGTPELPSVQAVVENLTTAIVARYGDVFHRRLAWADKDIAAGWNPYNAKRDTPLGNLFTDAYQAYTGTDVALEAIGLLDDAIPAGAVVGADIFRAMSLSISAKVVDGKLIVRPVRLATFRMSGEALLAALETTIALGDNYFPQVAGLRMVIDSDRPAFERILGDTVHVNGHRIAADRIYTVTTTEYVYGALASLNIPMQDVAVLPDLAFDAARSFVESRGEIVPAATGRIRDLAARR